MFEEKINLLVGILACHHRAQHLQAVRGTWVKDAKKFDYRFFFGFGKHDSNFEDEVIMDCDDAYRGLACKVQSSVQWALANGYTSFVKVDDDTYVRPERLVRAAIDEWGKHDFVGVVLPATDQYHKQGYARGGPGYYLSYAAMKVLAAAPKPNPDIPSEYAEDSWVALTLAKANIVPVNDSRLRCAEGSGPGRAARKWDSEAWKRDIPLTSNKYITTCEFLGSEMLQVHSEWQKSCTRRDDMLQKLRIK